VGYETDITESYLGDSQVEPGPAIPEPKPKVKTVAHVEEDVVDVDEAAEVLAALTPETPLPPVASTVAKTIHPPAKTEKAVPFVRYGALPESYDFSFAHSFYYKAYRH
jgi:hypothetical protein